MAEVTTAPGLPSTAYSHEDDRLSTLHDPRSTTAMSSPSPISSTSSSSTHPDLSREVESLSNKLINAINHQTDLDDTLSATRHELQAAKDRIKQLEAQAQEHNNLIAQGTLVQRAEVDKLRSTLAEERKQRAETEKDKKAIELELENLTSALFEEANKMVITARENARHEYEILQKKNELLKTQLADSESLLKSSQEQLAELKAVMEQMTIERDDQTNPTTPSTPGIGRFEGPPESESLADSILETPSYPTSFTHLLHPVLRFDLASYDEFTSLVRLARNSAGSRVSSGSYSGLGLGLGLGAYTPNAIVNGSNSSLPATSPSTPGTPASAGGNAANAAAVQLPPLKDTKFYKRALAEDIEPTLRLDTAPGLSWLARRSVLNAMCEGTLVVEPMPSSVTSTFKLFTYACALCGETRKDPEHIRTHRFKTSESDSAQRYPLCKYCHGRVRSTCDFLGFLRILHKGHWRTEGEESERAAWEESVRLREQMFWCRMGGGVLPGPPNASTNASVAGKSPRHSEELKEEDEEKESTTAESATPQPASTPQPEQLEKIETPAIPASPPPSTTPVEILDTSPRSAAPSPFFKAIEERTPFKMTRTKATKKIVIGGSRRGSDEDVATVSSEESVAATVAEEPKPDTTASESGEEMAAQISSPINQEKETSLSTQELPEASPEEKSEIDEAQVISQSIPGGF